MYIKMEDNQHPHSCTKYHQ